MALMTPKKDINATAGAKRFNSYSAEYQTANDTATIKANTDEVEGLIREVSSKLNTLNAISTKLDKLDTIVSKLQELIEKD